MGSTPDAPERKVAREATDWFLLLTEEPDDRELRNRFQEWHDASPLHASAWQATLRMSAAMGQVKPAHREVWSRHPREVAPLPVSIRARPSSPWRPVRRIGATLAAAAVACAALLWAPALLVQLRSDHATSTAELRTVTLEDGSEVILAPRSAIAVDYAAGERRVDLLQGMAFFDVRKNSDRPFRVQAGTLQTTVLGTRFEMNRTDDSISVSVEEGLVAVNDSRQPSIDARLRAGQSTTIGRDGATSRDGQQSVAAWRQRLLLADDRTVADAVSDLARYYSGTIVIADASLGQRRVTGVYGLGDPEATLRDIARVIGADVRRVSPWVLILNSK